MSFAKIAAAAWMIVPILLGGCNLVPEKRVVPRIHNPFPQMHTIAVLPFFNQSDDPTVDGEATAAAYYAALQSVDGFEVLPVGVTRRGLDAYIANHGEPSSGPQFQSLAAFLGVDAVVVGSVTDFDAFYPPRLAMTTRWYAANPSFHPIPAGYGLPWGTEAEEHIPRRIVEQAEFELARQQLRTQTPDPSSPARLATPTMSLQPPPAMHPDAPELTGSAVLPSSPDIFAMTEPDSMSLDPMAGPSSVMASDSMAVSDSTAALDPMVAADPQPWPDPTGFIPDPPSPVPLIPTVSHEAVLSHTRLYRGNDAYVTERLADYVESGDDARPSGWQGYLRRSDDFVRFCCHLHITEMLESRGGQDQSDLIVRWPMSRY